MTIVRRTEGLVFGCAFVAFAWFHQGGGWNQNSRFALVRAIVEHRTFFIDDFLLYIRPGARGTKFMRPDVQRGQFTIADHKYALGWRDRRGLLLPIAGSAEERQRIIDSDSIQLRDVASVGMSGDIAFHGEHFHPNKAPGTSFLAVPAYFVLFHVERVIGADPDEWFFLTVNAWLTSVFSVGLLSALGVVLLYRFARRLSGEDGIAAFVALTFAFGTMWFPYATMLYEHNIIAVALLASWALLHWVRTSAPTAGWLVAMAGLCAGYAAITNYIMVVPLLLLAAYGMDQRRVTRAAWFGLGVAGPFALICAYNIACFGTPFTTNYRYENPQFLETSGALFGVLGTPNVSVLVKLLISPFRGLFVTSPVLLLGVDGLIRLWGARPLRRDAALCTAMIAFFLLFNMSFNGWHGGFAATPRYLAPMLPFLVVPMIALDRRLRRAAGLLSFVSVAAMLLITAVDPQAPLGNSAITNIPHKAQWTYSPLTDYELPLLLEGQATPLLNALRAADSTAPAKPYPLEMITGPVSVNPVGMYESDYFQRFKAGESEVLGNSFNLGEFLVPGSALSLAPMLVICGALAVLILVGTRPAVVVQPTPEV